MSERTSVASNVSAVVDNAWLVDPYSNFYR